MQSDSPNVLPIRQNITTIEVKSDDDRKEILETVQRVSGIMLCLGEELARHESQKLLLMRVLLEAQQSREQVVNKIGTKLGANFESEDWAYDFSKCEYNRA